MMMRILLLFLAIPCFAQQKEIRVDHSIEHVTVFLEGAQIRRSVSSEIPSGKTTLILSSLSPYIRKNTIQVKGEGGGTILSVRQQMNHISELDRSRKADSLSVLIENLQREYERKEARLKVLSEKQQLLFANRKLSDAGTSTEALEAALNLFDRELMKISNEAHRLNGEMKDLSEEMDKLASALNDIRNREDLPSSEIHILIEARQRTSIQLQISYMVDNAGWFPSYDIRVSDISKPISMHYKAEVYQQTGVDWNNVKLRFSNADPGRTGSMPDLPVWRLNFLRYSNRVNQTMSGFQAARGQAFGRVTDMEGNPLPGVNVVVKGTTIGTVTDIDGSYSLALPSGDPVLVFSFVGLMTEEVPVTSSVIDVQMMEDVKQLSEVVVTGYASDRSSLYGATGAVSGLRVRGASSLPAQKTETITAGTVVNQTTVEFEVDRPYSVPSDGEKRQVLMKVYDIPATYAYYAVPKLDKDAFLVARISDWSEFHLMEGQANLYFEEAFVGQTVLDASTLADTLDISLGRDRSIVIGREKINTYEKTQNIGSNRLETRGFRITVRNNKNRDISITLLDQLPKPVNNDISVSAEELSGGEFDEETSEIRWKLVLPAGGQKDLDFKYSVKYPKREKVILE